MQAVWSFEKDRIDRFLPDRLIADVAGHTDFIIAVHAPDAATAVARSDS